MEFFKNIIKPILLAARIWILTSLVFGLGWLLYTVLFDNDMGLWLSALATVCAGVGSLPVLLVLAIVLPRVEDLPMQQSDKINRLVLASFICTVPYGLIGGSVFAGNYNNDKYWTNYLLYTLAVTGVLFSCSIVAMLLSRNTIMHFFSSPQNQTHSLTQINLQMETEQSPYVLPEETTHSNKTLFKGLITGALILIMMIPTIFVSNLVTERERRQEEVVKEVSGKWASEQTIAGPYIYVPYTVNVTDKNNKVEKVSKHLLFLPDNLDVTGNLSPEIRPRSIYKVLLYKSSLKSSGNFVIRIPKEIDTASLQLADAKICFGITDFKGIEERIAIDFDKVSYELSPGLPVNDVDTNGLSAPINLTAADIGKRIDFNMQLKIKGSEQLHFVPLSGNSSVALQSTWNNPSFDGNNLPGERKVDKDGFSAKWTINKANLPFGTVLRGAEFNKNSFAFGVSMLQPADQYAKTMRSVKYAILFIGLTFSLFFIVEVMQKRPLHPVQYVLVGLALVIFYTLLLSFSEFILFDQAYLIASLATILLITLYAKSHFENWKTAALFGSVLCGLYGFIFILIRLEDTALLVGSIGLFLVLAMVMYGSRKINWYNATTVKKVPASI
ncbi:MAG: cell envelope integrity protein CreD [Chitinophagaceae bacterium]